MKTLIAALAGLALLATPALAENYLIHDQDGHGVTYCEWADADILTEWSHLNVPADATEVRECLTHDERSASQIRIDKLNSKPQRVPFVPAPTPNNPNPVTPTDPGETCTPIYDSQIIGYVDGAPIKEKVRKYKTVCTPFGCFEVPHGWEWVIVGYEQEPVYGDVEVGENCTPNDPS